MSGRYLIPLLVFLFAASCAAPRARAKEPAADPVATLPTRPYADWKAACLKMPSNRAAHGRLAARPVLPLPRFQEFDALLAAFFARQRSGAIGDTNLWVGHAPTAGGFYNADAGYFAQPGAPTTPIIQEFIRDAHPFASTARVSFQPFARKVDLEPGSELFVHADLHGDIRSLLAELDWLGKEGYMDGFRIVRPGFHLLFLGDYTDRGLYGIEVLYTLLRLDLENPGRVFLARGNHEEASIASRYGFLSEGRMKYGADFDPKRVLRVYDFLPVVIYIGAAGNYLQCHHGGMEPGHDPRALLGAAGASGFQLLGVLAQRRFHSAHPDWFGPADAGSSRLFARDARDFVPEDPLNPTLLGYMWNDFTLFADEPAFGVDPGRGFVYGKRAAEYLMARTRTATNGVQAVIRGHQQASALNPMMRRLVAGGGVFRHWQDKDSASVADGNPAELAKAIDTSPTRAIPQGSVWTLNISPDTAYGEACGFDFDAFAIIKTAPAFADWRLRVIDVPGSF